MRPATGGARPTCTSSSIAWTTPVPEPLPEAAPPPAPVEEPPPAVEIEIAAGEAEQPSYSFQFVRIDLGRCTQVRDRRNHLVRTNHVAFADTDDAINRTVSRRHAHLEYSAAERAFRVYDDGSEQGTAVSRGGRTIAVPPGARGVRLQPGDEILLGTRGSACAWFHRRGRLQAAQYVAAGLRTRLNEVQRAVFRPPWSGASKGVPLRKSPSSREPTTPRAQSPEPKAFVFTTAAAS